MNVHAIDDNLSLNRLNQSEQGKRKRRLSSTCPANNSNFLTRRDSRSDVSNDQICSRTIAGRIVLEDNCTIVRPSSWRSLLGDDPLGFTFDF